MNEINTNTEKLEKIIFEFIKNRTDQNESTASRHIHQRFDIDMEKAEQILTDLSEKNSLKNFMTKNIKKTDTLSKNIYEPKAIPHFGHTV